MGVRIIGDTRNTTGRVQQPTRRIQIADADGKPIELRPVIEQHPIDGDDSIEQHSTNGEGDYVDPAVAAGSSGDSAPFGYTKSGRKRNRPVGGSTRQSRSTSKTTDSIAAMLYTLNGAAGMLLKMPRLKIPRSGCEELASRIVDLTEYYGNAFGVSDEILLWSSLGMSIAKVYIFDEPETPKQQGPQVTPKAPIPMPSFMAGNGRPN